MLRNYLGDDAFFGGISKFLHDHEYGTAEAVEIRLAFEKVSGRDLNWFFDQWYFGGGNPKLNIAYTYNPTTKKVKVTVVQSQSNYFEFPFAIATAIAAALAILSLSKLLVAAKPQDPPAKTRTPKP